MLRLLAVVALVLFAPEYSYAQSKDGDVISGVATVLDGATFSVKFGGDWSEKVRLWSIKVPTRGEAGWGAAKEALAELAEQQSVICVIKRVEKDGSAIAVCELVSDGMDLGVAQLAMGWAHADPRDGAGTSKFVAYQLVERAARCDRRGQWVLLVAEELTAC